MILNNKIKLIYTGNSNPELNKFDKISDFYGFKLGIQLPSPRKTVNTYFTDQNWKKPNKEKFFQDLKEKQPYITTVLDLEHEEQFVEVMLWAYEASKHVKEAVIIIPKCKNVIHKIPYFMNNKEVLLGYSIPSKHGGTDLSIEDFAGRKIHLLGGSADKQFEYANKHGIENVYSIDINYHTFMARFNRVFTNGKHLMNIRKRKLRNTQLRYIYKGYEQDSMYMSFTLSCINIMAMWEGCKTMIRFATEEDIDGIANVWKENKQWLGRIFYQALRKAIAKQQLYVATDSNTGEVVGFVNWYLKKDGTATIYEIAVKESHRNNKIATGLIAAMPNTTIRLKCTVDNPANEFYEKLGFRHVATEEGVKRELNVWIKQKVINMQ